MSGNLYIMTQTAKAKELAVNAVHYEKDGNITEAIVSYDESILFIDDVLSQIPPTSDAWKLLMGYREKYNDRMVCNM